MVPLFSEVARTGSLGNSLLLLVQSTEIFSNFGSLKSDARNQLHFPAERDKLWPSESEVEKTAESPPPRNNNNNSSRKTEVGRIKKYLFLTHSKSFYNNKPSAKVIIAVTADGLASIYYSVVEDALYRNSLPFTSLRYFT